jgi:tetratricopeptide (TPR) repeat protein
MRIRPRQERAALGVVFFGCALALFGCRTASARSLRPEPAPDDLQAGVKLFEQGQFAQAEAALRNAEGPEAQAYLAGSLAKQKKYVEAEAPAKAALEANPTHPVAVAALGESLVGQKKHDEAVSRLSTVIKAKPDLAYAYFWRGQAYYGKKQQDKMAEDYTVFLKLEPKAPEAPIIQQILAGLR